MTDYRLVPVDLLSELAESLACELDARYPASVRSYESQDRKYQAEMEPVLTARQIIAAAPAVQGEPVYLYRRRGLRSFETCNHVQYAELSAKPRLFETRVLYTAPQPAPDVAGLVEALERSVAGFDALSGMASLDAGARNYARQKAIELNARLAAHRKQQEGQP